MPPITRRLALSGWLAFAGTALAQALAPADGAPRLVATVVHSDPSRSMAMVSLGAAPSQTVRTGQTLAGGYIVHTIERDRLLLERSGQLHSLPVQAPMPAPVATASPQRLPTASPAHGLLQAQDLRSLRAACADSEIMAALPDVQRAELATVGICPQR